MQRNGPLALAFHTLVVGFMLAPLVIVCLVAFTPANTLSIPWGEVSLRWFRAVFEHSDLVQSFWNSLAVATIAATVAVVLAVPAALAIALALLVVNLAVMLSTNALLEGAYRRRMG